MALVVRFLAFVVLVVAIPARADTPTEAFFDAIARMNGIAQPRYVSYEVVMRAANAQYTVTRDPQTGRAEYGFSVGGALGNTDQRYEAVIRTADATTAVRLGNEYARTNFPALNATWSGIDDWLRFGVDGKLPSNSSAPPAPTAVPSSDAQTIAVVHSLTAPAYTVSGGAPETCDGAEPGRIYYLRAKSDPYRHPATDVVVANATGTVCTIRFGIERDRVVDRDGHVELHLRKIGATYLVDHGEIAFVPNPRFGVPRVRIFIDYVGVAFPRTAPVDAFRSATP